MNPRIASKGLVGLVILLTSVVPLPSFSGIAQEESAFVNPTGGDGADFWVSPSQEIVLRWEWSACTRGQVTEFLQALVSESYVMDGEPLFESTAELKSHWSTPVENPTLVDSCMGAKDMAWAAYWEFSVGQLPLGEHVLHASAGLSHPVTNGLDADGDGKPDLYSGTLFDTEISIHVTALAPLIVAAREEGSLTVIALPDDWCNYGSVMNGFAQTYGIPVNSVSPSASSADELQAIRDGIENQGPDTPDVIDVGPGFAVEAQSEGLTAPYRVSTWDTIPDFMKDNDGYWYGDYYGVMAIAANSTYYTSPSSWEDLRSAENVGPVALGGDPTVSNMGFFSVFGAALANGGSLDNIEPGLLFFRDLNNSGRLLPDIGSGDTLASGETPVLLEWTYLALAQRDLNPEAQIEVVVAQPGAIASFYAQAVSAYAPHPNAARLWMEYLYSDVGQLGWLEGYCFPARFDDLLARNVIPEELLARLPDPTGIPFPSLDQIIAAQAFVEANWACTVYGCP